MNANVEISSLRLDGNTQSREKTDEAAVNDYAETLEAANGSGWPFPRVTVFSDGDNAWLADGFHRVAAAKRCGLEAVPADIRDGTARDAFLFGLDANNRNGVRYKASDKRAIVERLIRDDEWGKRSQRWIAERAGVSNKTVSAAYTRLNLEPPKIAISRDGIARKMPSTEEFPQSDNEYAEDEGASDFESESRSVDVEHFADPEPQKPAQDDRAEFRALRLKIRKQVADSLREIYDLNRLVTAKNHLANCDEWLTSILESLDEWGKA